MAIQKIPVSMRLPSDVVGHIDRIASSTGSTRTDVLVEALSAHQAMESLRTFQKGGSIQTYTMDKELLELLEVAGCTIVGIGVYQVVSHMMDNAKDVEGKKRFNDAERFVVGSIAGLAVAMAALGLVKKLTGSSNQ